MMLTERVLGVFVGRRSVVVAAGGGWRLRRRPDNHRPVCMEEGAEADDAVGNGEATVSGVDGEVGAGGHGREEGTRHCCPDRLLRLGAGRWRMFDEHISVMCVELLYTYKKEKETNNATCNTFDRVKQPQ